MAAPTLIARTPRFDVVERQAVNAAGKPYVSYFIEKRDAVSIVLENDGAFLLLDIHREGQPPSLEFPGGGIEIGESPEQAAARELEEETALRCDALTRIAILRPSPGLISESVHVFRGAALPNQDARPPIGEEGIRGHHWRTPEALSGLCLTGQISSAVDACIALMLAARAAK